MGLGLDVDREAAALAAIPGLALRGLTPAQWDTPSLCTEWRVRDVALHVVSYDELSALTLGGCFLRGRFRVSKVNDLALAQYADVGPDGVIELVSRNLGARGLPSWFGGGIALTDGTIHHQDIRRALGLTRTVPNRSLVPVLDFALGAPTLPARRNARGLGLVATDIDWTAGAGPEVTGAGEALLMAVAGRPQALGELSGDGLPTLRRRVEQVRRLV